MQHVPLVEVTRGDQAECVHYGSVAVVDTAGRVLYRAGDPEFLTFTRSTIKPLQALPFMLGDGPARFGYSQRELALLCASLLNRGTTRKQDRRKNRPTRSLKPISSSH